MDFEYVIIGDTPIYTGCLLYVVGVSKERAEEVLNRMLNNPNVTDRYLMKDVTNIRISTVDKKNCWWHEGCD